MSNSNKPTKFSHGPHVIEMIKASTVCFMKVRNSLVVLWKEKRVNWEKKSQDSRKKSF